MFAKSSIVVFGALPVKQPQPNYDGYFAQVNKQFHSFLSENLSCGYSFEAPGQGASNDYR